MGGCSWAWPLFCGAKLPVFENHSFFEMVQYRKQLIQLGSNQVLRSSTSTTAPPTIELIVVSHWQPPTFKATPIALFFDGLCVGASNKGARCGECKLAAGQLQRTHTALPMEREGKAAGGWAMAAHFVVVCLLCLCVLCCALL